MRTRNLAIGVLGVLGIAAVFGPRGKVSWRGVGLLVAGAQILAVVVALLMERALGAVIVVAAFARDSPF